MTTRATDRPLSIPYDSLTLQTVVAELADSLLGGQIQDVRQPDQTELQLAIRSRGQNYLLQLSADAHFARAHLTSRRSPNAPIPSAFCMALRRHIEGGKIMAIRQVRFDRILEIAIGGSDAADTEADHTLIAELMGKHSNLILIDHAGRIVDSAKRITSRINRLRETLPALPYQPPPHTSEAQSPSDPETLTAMLLELRRATPADTGELAKRLRTGFPDLSPFLAQEIALRVFDRDPPGSDPDIGLGPRLLLLRNQFGETFFPEGEDMPSLLQTLWTALFVQDHSSPRQPVSLSAALGAGAYPIPLVQSAPEAQQSVPNLNAALDAGYTRSLQRDRIFSLLHALRGRIDREVKRQERLQQSVERTLAEGHRSEEYKQSGELLLANLRLVLPGAETLVVTDYYDPAQGQRAIALDPKLSPHANADAYFRRYRKARDGQEIALVRGMEAERALTQLRSVQARLADWESTLEVEAESIRQLQAELIASNLLREQGGGAEASVERRSPDFQGHKIRGYTTPEGYEIYLGETATANDYLTTHLAAPNDLWLHVRAAPSAHVIIRTQGKPDQVPPSVLLYAALLCAQHSGQKHSSMVPVDYTLKKYVRKPRGAAPGSVQITREKTLHISPKPD